MENKKGSKPREVADSERVQEEDDDVSSENDLNLLHVEQETIRDAVRRLDMEESKVAQSEHREERGDANGSSISLDKKLVSVQGTELKVIKAPDPDRLERARLLAAEEAVSPHWSKEFGVVDEEDWREAA